LNCCPVRLLLFFCGLFALGSGCTRGPAKVMLPGFSGGLQALPHLPAGGRRCAGAMVVAGVGYRGGRSCAGTMVALLFVGSWSDAGAAVAVFCDLVCSRARSRPWQSSARAAPRGISSPTRRWMFSLVISRSRSVFHFVCILH